MARSTSSWFNNGIVGIPQIGADVDIYDVHDTPRYAVGTHFTRSDGAVFVYSHFGDVLHLAGLLCAQDFSESGCTQVDSLVIEKKSVTQVAGEQFDVNTTGSYYIQMTSGNISKDQFAGGYILISQDDSAGGITHQGHTYRIRGNTASGNPATQQFYIELYSPLQGTVGSTSDVSICGCVYSNLESVDAVTDNDIVVAGVNMSPILTAGQYGWVQKSGVVGIQGDPSYPAVAGDMVTVSDTDTGQCTHASEHSIASIFKEPIIGYCIDPGGADAEFAMIHLIL